MTATRTTATHVCRTTLSVHVGGSQTTFLTQNERNINNPQFRQEHQFQRSNEKKAITMADQQQPISKQSRASEFMRSAGTVNDPDHKLWGPVKWVAQMVQYLIALVMISTFVR